MLYEDCVSGKDEALHAASMLRHLPTMTALFRKQVVDSRLCPRCREESEDVLYALVGCNKVQGIWGYMEREVPLEMAGDFASWWEARRALTTVEGRGEMKLWLHAGQYGSLGTV